MNRKDDFDQTLAAWLRREAPPQAPDRVLDAALERVAAQSQARGWLDRLQRGTQMGRILRATAVAAVVAIAVFIGFQFSNLTSNVGNSPSPSASASAAPDGSPTPSALSSDPAVGRLVLRLESGTETGVFHVVTVLEDGRIITNSGQGGANLVEQRLTAAAVQLLRDELDATGLTDTSANYPPIPKPGIEPPGRGGSGYTLEVGLSGGGTAVISWERVADDNDLYYEPSPERMALDRLAVFLNPFADQWLPANAWADANARPYAPAHYRIFIEKQQWGGSLDDLPVESATVSWPLDEGIDAFGDVMEDPAGEPVGARCGVVSAGEATAVIEALEAAGATPAVRTWTSFDLGDRATSRVVTITLEPIMPDETTCEGATIPF